MKKSVLVLIAIVGYLTARCRCEDENDILQSRVRRSDSYGRPDYKWHSGMYYRFFNTPETFQVAQEMCRQQGSHLAVPKTTNDVVFLTSLYNKSTSRIWVGMHSLYSPQAFITVNGEHIDGVYNDWERNEPADIDDGRSCVILNGGKLFANTCKNKHKYICASKSWRKPKNKNCKGYSSGYRISKDGTVCYKAYDEPNTWEWAFKICNADGARLPRIRNGEQGSEVGALAMASMNNFALMKQHIVSHPYCSVGFNTFFFPDERRFIYDDGTSLRDYGYDSWSPNEPNNGNRDEHCGCINLSGLLCDVPCNKSTDPIYFVCESDKS